ncbi:cell wall hydrolase/autolysin [Calothrix sp. NIES-4101]|nr:cell wall hydrolase/autolysin [Calothrix sp. NIES-4101]
MGRIFISAAHGGREGGRIDPGTVAGGTTEAREMILLRDLIVTELRSRNWEVLSVPDDLSAQGTITWINSRSRPRDVALEIQTDAAASPSVRGATVYYIANNSDRRKHAEILLLALLRKIPQLPNRGVKPDTNSGFGSLIFCRQTTIASLQMQVGFLTSPDDRSLLQNRRRDFAVGIADGLASWAGIIDPGSIPPEINYPIININVNGKNVNEKGVLINGNSYIPISLLNSLNIDLSTAPDIRQVAYKQIIYIKAVDLQRFNVSVGWDGTTRTVKLRSNLASGQIDKIMSSGKTTKEQLESFLKNNHNNALIQFPDITQLYIDEANKEGVNYDIAFSQMCLETDYLRFSGDIKAEQNNFAGLGTVGGGSESATFESARIGVRAHIQHLKAYASSEPLQEEVVDPRFRFVTRGVAPLVGDLSGRWSASLDYGTRILAILRKLYDSTQ